MGKGKKNGKLRISLIFSCFALILSLLNFGAYYHLQGESNKMTGNAIQNTQIFNELSVCDKIIAIHNLIGINKTNAESMSNIELCLEAMGSYVQGDLEEVKETMGKINTSSQYVITGSAISLMDMEQKELSFVGILFFLFMVLITIILIIFRFWNKLRD